MSYSPKELGLTLSYECNLRCAHCIVSAGPKEKGTINHDVAVKILDQAQSNGIKHVLLYGGEPFLQKGLMFDIAEQALIKRFNVYINSNGSWGESRESARDNLRGLQELTMKYKKSRIGISLSVDQYHQPQIPINSIANIIAEHRLGEYPNIQLDLGSLKGSESDKLLADLVAALYRQGIHLALSKFQPFLYPALSSELKDYGKKERKNLIVNLGLTSYASDRLIEKTLSENLPGQRNKKRDETIPLIYNCFSNNLLSFGRTRPYIIVPDNYLIKLSRSDLIKAGKSTEGNNLNPPEFNALFIDPFGNAFTHPAFMRSQEGIPINNKPLSQVIFEVGQSLER